MGKNLSFSAALDAIRWRFGAGQRRRATARRLQALIES
jgi:hypothetical protein